MKWIELNKIRDLCNISIEEKRSAKIIGSSLEASLKIKLDKTNLELAKDIDFAELCITSSAIIEMNNDNKISVVTEKIKGNKCPVCWKISSEPCPRHEQK